jgi:hypothetical protein
VAVASAEVAKSNVVAVPAAAFAARALETVTLDFALAKKSAPALPPKVTVNTLPAESARLVHVTVVGILFFVDAHVTVGVASAVKMAVDAVIVTLLVAPPATAVCGMNDTTRLVGVAAAV